MKCCLSLNEEAEADWPDNSPFSEVLNVLLFLSGCMYILNRRDHKVRLHRAITHGDTGDIINFYSLRKRNDSINNNFLIKFFFQ